MTGHTGCPRQIEAERQTEKERERDREKERDRERILDIILLNTAKEMWDICGILASSLVYSIIIYI